MPENSESSSNALFRGGKGKVYEYGLLGGSREQLNDEELPKQPMSKDEEVLALLGYKQGSKTCVSFQRCSPLIQTHCRVESWARSV